MDMEKRQTAMPIIAGILAIVHAVLGFFCLFCLILTISCLPVEVTTFPNHTVEYDYVPLIVLLCLAIPCTIISILSMVGGIFAILRRNWGLALAGSIATLIPTLLLGIPAVILIALSKDEFD
jgi:hypothetical protein